MNVTKVIGKTLADTSFRRGLAVFLLHKMCTTIAALFSMLLAPSFVLDLPRDHAVGIGIEQLFVEAWVHWDSNWFLGIAQSGYKFQALGQSSFNFFPLYPLIVWVVGQATRNLIYSGLLVSNFCFFLALVILFRLVSMDHGERAALRSILYLALFPASFVFTSLYNASLFLLVIVSSLYFAARRRWAISGFAGMLASLTFGYGVMIFFPIAYEYLRSSGFRLSKVDLKYLTRALPLLLPGLGVFIWMIYNYQVTGDFFYWAHATAGWTVSFQPPWTAIMTSTGLALSGAPSLVMSVANDYELVTEIVLLSVVAYTVVRRPIRMSLTFWLVIVATIYLCAMRTGWSEGALLALPLGGTPIYLLLNFPFFVTLGVACKSSLSQYCIIAVASSQMFLLAFLFTSGFWLAL